MDEHCAKWHETLRIYFAVKQVFILSEELDDDLCSSIQPINQLRDALDHLMRVVAVTTNFRDTTFSLDELPKDFVDKNFNAAMNHLYRAFFDACDSVSISYREGIAKNLEGFSKDVILTALPTYYQTMKPRIEAINNEIAAMRNSKGQYPKSREKGVDHYLAVLDELQKYYRETTAAEVSLIELQKIEKSEQAKASKEADREKRFQAVLAIACAVGGAVIGVMLGVLLH
ncbi:hypothetical protein GMI69_01465 [Eggerthellaceae bacterium zg-887]|uniref:hypothetical protein n=1 Tax=Xiamenia xianingshaonis TaxID=2682776 RepID=UPI00140B55CC|nr:hypothetical protein [Xiamenia xianingshaonis]NHM15344.1 hypothetical protein [Xiamenia xianingshaonis]